MNIIERLKYMRINFVGRQTLLDKWLGRINEEVNVGCLYLGSFPIMHEGKMTGRFVYVYIRNTLEHLEVFRKDRSGRYFSDIIVYNDKDGNIRVKFAAENMGKVIVQIFE